MTKEDCERFAAMEVSEFPQQELSEMIPIKEYYVVDKECKNSVRYRARSKNSPLAGMTIYVPRSIIKSDPPPGQLLMTMQVMAVEEQAGPRLVKAVGEQ
jgi:hypothetical protein